MTDFSQFAVRRTSTAEQIADGLTAMIVRGDLAPGEPIRESTLASTLGVSRNTVREAVRILGQGGLVRHELHHGTIVREPSIPEVAELYRVRKMLEREAVETARLPDDLDGVRQAFAELAAAAEAGDAATTIAMDLGFHGAIVALHRSPRLDRFFADLANEQRFYLAVLSLIDDEYASPDKTISEHGAVLRALEAEDRTHARSLLDEHIEANAGRVIAILEEREQGLLADSPEQPRA